MAANVPYCVLLLAVSTVLCVTIDVASGGRFGEGLPTLPVAETEGWPDTLTFMEQYVLPMKPVVMRGAVANSRAARLWRNDDYFLNVQIGDADDEIQVETMKKESRKQRVDTVKFKEFIRSYNQSGYYMVSAVPSFLRQDVPLPGPLQCDQLYEDNLVENVMWITSGGTRSVVHTDAAENINCQYVGVKMFVIVDPDKYGAQVEMDHPEGSYCGVDVDNVNYTKYPGLADVEYYVVNVSAGDCIFLPYRWIHQVRSFGRNIAVNLWFDHFKNKNVDLDKCEAAPKSEMTFEGLRFTGFDSVTDDPDAMKDHMMSITKHRGDLTPEKLLEVISGDADLINSVLPGKDQLTKIFGMLDTNSDGLLSHTEVKEAPNDLWVTVGSMFDELQKAMDVVEEEEEDLPEEDLTGDIVDAEDKLGGDWKEAEGEEAPELNEDEQYAEATVTEKKRDEL